MWHYIIKPLWVLYIFSINCFWSCIYIFVQFWVAPRQLKHFEWLKCMFSKRTTKFEIISHTIWWFLSKRIWPCCVICSILHCSFFWLHNKVEVFSYFYFCNEYFWKDLIDLCLEKFAYNYKILYGYRYTDTFYKNLKKLMNA